MLFCSIPAMGHSADVTLAWDQPQESSPIAGYQIYYGNPGNDYTSSPMITIESADQTRCEVTGLAPGVSYGFVATSYNDKGDESPFSEEFVYTVPDADSDGDGLTDTDETERYGTDPQIADTDGDGIDDGDEVDYWGSDWQADADRDGIINILDADSDNDGINDGTEIAQGSDPSYSADNASSSEFVMESGKVQLNHEWTTVSLEKSFDHPVVVAKSLSSNGGQPAVIRVRNVSAGGFEIRIQEWDYLDGYHITESACYIVMEAGVHKLADGNLVEAGMFEVGNSGQKNFQNLSFMGSFSQVPVVAAAVTTFAGGQAVTGRIAEVSRSGFNFGLQEQEANADGHVTETVSYIAWEPSSGRADGFIYEVARAPNGIDNQNTQLFFDSAFIEAPFFVADIQTLNESDPANLRWHNLDKNAVSIRVTEEASADSEEVHDPETIGFMAFKIMVDTDADGLVDTEEVNIYGTQLNNSDTDGDGINDGNEVLYWGSDWKADADGDGVINILDADADNDGIKDGTEIDQGSDPAYKKPEADPDSSGFVMECGEVQLNHEWTTVSLEKSFDHPVVVTKSMSSNDAQPAVIRVRNVSASGFEIRVQEWEYLDDDHGVETASYIVMEAGSYTLPDGSVVEAGTFLASDFKAVSFDSIFAEMAPVVVASCITHNGGQAITGRISNVSQYGFDYQLQEQEANTDGHVYETISYIAWEPSIGEIDGRVYEVARAEKGIDDAFGPVLFVNEYGNSASCIADMQTMDGANTANLRYRNKNAQGIEFRIAEECSADNETAHIEETVGYILIESNATQQPEFVMESGEVEMTQAWQTVSLNKKFENPVVVAGPLSFNGGNPAVVRIANVSNSSFDIRIQEWDYLDGWHVSETVGYIVMESGSHVLANSARVEAGTFQTDTANYVEFRHNFDTLPVVFSNVTSDNDQEAVKSRIYNIWKDGFNFELMEQEANSDGHDAETIAYIAWEPSLGEVDGIPYEVMRTSSGISEELYYVSFTQSFMNSPLFMANMQTKNGANPATLRWLSRDSNGLEMFLHEEESADSETIHVPEAVGCLIMKK